MRKKLQYVWNKEERVSIAPLYQFTAVLFNLYIFLWYIYVYRAFFLPQFVAVFSNSSCLLRL